MDEVTQSLVQEVGAALVREYLSRKGLGNTLKMMDSEFPRTSHSISNRLALAKHLHIEKLLCRNKEDEKPLCTMIEIIVKYLIQKAISSPSKKYLKSAINVENTWLPDLSRKENVCNVQTTLEVGTDVKSDKISESNVQVDLESQSNIVDVEVTECLVEEFVDDSEKVKDEPEEIEEGCSVQEMNREDRIIRTPRDGSTDMQSSEINSPESLTQHKANDRKPTEGTKILTKPDNNDKKKDILSNITQPRSRKGSEHVDLGSTVKMQESPSSEPLVGNARSRRTIGPLGLTAPMPHTARPRRQTNTSPASDLFSFDAKKCSEETKSTSQSDVLAVGNALRAKEKILLSSLSMDMKTLTGLERDKWRSTTQSQKSLSRLNEGAKNEFTIDFSNLATIGDEKVTESTSRHMVQVERKSGMEQRTRNPCLSSDKLNSSFESEKSPVDSPGSKDKNITSYGDLECYDIDDMDTSMSGLIAGSQMLGIKTHMLGSSPITLSVAMNMKQLILGAATASFSSEWLGQSFTFNSNPKLQYGLVQKKGGPCGVLASMQAFLLKSLLFGSNMVASLKSSGNLNICDEELHLGLVSAISEILWQAGQRESATVALCSGRPHFSGSGRYRRDGLTETLNLFVLTSKEALVSCIEQNLNQFYTDGSSGCLILLFSAILSRGIDRVKSDMDEAVPLIGQHGYCTLELVNLLLTGRAASNVFDNNMEIDKCVLHGVSSRSDVGLLSLFEHYNSCQVGSFLKTPRYPLWVVCSESHFSVLFSKKLDLVCDWRAEKHFDLYYYDGLAQQEDEIRLTIDTSGHGPSAERDEDLVPPLEHCIRTKWKGASVDWNGTEPFL